MTQPPDMSGPVGAVCPYCEHILDRRPQRKTECPHCGEHIYVRALPTGEHHKVLVTEDEAKRIDLEWKRVQATKEWLQRLEQYGISGKDLDAHREMLRERFGQEPGEGDVIWSLFHEALDRAMKRGDLHELKMLYFEMALFLYEEGRDFFQLLEQARRMELAKYKRDGFVQKVQILTQRDASCEACRKLHGKVLALEDALEQMPVPCKDCTFDFRGTGRPGWCRCSYLTVVD